MPSSNCFGLLNQSGPPANKTVCARLGWEIPKFGDGGHIGKMPQSAMGSTDSWAPRTPPSSSLPTYLASIVNFAPSEDIPKFPLPCTLPSSTWA